MKTLATVFVLAPMALLYGAPSEIGLLPDEKKPVVVSAEERNPFGRIAPKTPEAVQVEVESEESKIRALVSGLALYGYTEGDGRKKILMGPYVVDPGKDLPQLIRNQTEKVRVVSVNDEKVELGFIEENGEVQGRTIVLPYNFSPVVRFKLGSDAGAPTGDAAAAAAAEAALGGVVKENDASGPSSK